MSTMASLLFGVILQGLPRLLPVLCYLLRLLRREPNGLPRGGDWDVGAPGIRGRDVRGSGESRPAVPAERVPLPGPSTAVRAEPRCGRGGGRGGRDGRGGRWRARG